MPTNKKSDKRKNMNKIHIECPALDIDETESSKEQSYHKLLDVGEEATFHYNEQSINITVDTLIEIRILGYGHFGYVMLTEVKHHPEIQMAVKRLNLLPNTNNFNEYTAQTDLRTLRTVGFGLNSHVTNFYTAIVDHEKKQLLLCMEACETSMEKFYMVMHKINETQYLDLLLKRMINHIVDALLFLKSKNILHRDVKPSNILINQNPIIFKLCDFGICSILIDSVSRTMMKGTQIYLAPERIDGNLSPHGYGIRSDMWALGLSSLEIATNEQPFRGLGVTDIMNKFLTWTPNLPSNLSTELQQLISCLLQVPEADRPKKYEDILASSAIQSLSPEITNGEIDMVKNVIEHIRQTREN